jgi:NTP pyrophosphatase (non-canonical NTP hydrolase)
MENNLRLGWEPNPERTFGDECALMHSEISEAFEAWRDHGFEDFTEVRRLDLSLPEQTLPKPEGVGSELADLVIRAAHYAAVHDIDLAFEIKRKQEYNRTRPWKHGGKAL